MSHRPFVLPRDEEFRHALLSVLIILGQVLARTGFCAPVCRHGGVEQVKAKSRDEYRA